MARRLAGGIQLLADTSSIAKFIGSAEALTESVRDKQYLTDVVKAAHGEAEQQFNLEAAAAAAAGANIRHMFEWGTQGINRRRTNVRPNPLSERARLWHTQLTGVGLNQTMTYVFKPSVTIVPKPTVGETGMDSETISQLNDHVFWNKAMVMETGASVTIQPVNSPILLIPYYESQRQSIMFSDSDIERGYTLSKGPHTHSPGDTSGATGSFTAFWSTWWETQGQTRMEKSIERQIQSDFFPALSTNYSTSNPTVPTPGRFKAEVEKQKKIIKRQAAARARARKDTR